MTSRRRSLDHVALQHLRSLLDVSLFSLNNPRFYSSHVASSYDVISESQLPGGFVSILKPRPRQFISVPCDEFRRRMSPPRAQPHHLRSLSLSLFLPLPPLLLCFSQCAVISLPHQRSSIPSTTHRCSFLIRPAGLKYSNNSLPGVGVLFHFLCVEPSALRLYGARNADEENLQGGKQRKPRGKMKSSTLIAAALAFCTSLVSAGVVITPVQIDQTVPDASGDCFFGVSTPFGCA